MLRVYADKFIVIGQRMADAGVHFVIVEGADTEQIKEYKNYLRENLTDLSEVYEDLSLETAADIIRQRINHISQYEGGFDVMLETVKDELRSRLFGMSRRICGSAATFQASGEWQVIDE